MVKTSVKGIRIRKGLTAKSLVRSYMDAGLQATSLAKAADLISRMKKDGATIILTFTSNMVSSGLREVFSYVLKNRMVDLVITGAGSIEEDLMKTQSPFLLGDFNMDDRSLHRQGMNRIGNILVPNKSYEDLEDIFVPFLERMLSRQKGSGKIISPSEFVYELGKTIKDQDSILYWATKNDIPIFCPAITDGAIGLQMFFFKQKHPEFSIDPTADMKNLAQIVLNSKKTGGIILGGGFAKHHAIGVNILRGGLDYVVYVSTASQYDGSMSGARESEAISWSKVKEGAGTVHVEGDASIIFPLIICSIL